MAIRPPTTITDLPSELIQHIASFLPAVKVLALLRVNRKMNDICDDDVMFKTLLKKAHLATDEIWLCPELQECTDRDKLKRFAVAHSSAIAWHYGHLSISLSHEETQERITSSLGWEAWAPQLAMLQHPLMAHIPVANLIAQLTLGLRAYGSRFNSPARREAACEVLQTVTFQAMHLLLVNALKDGPLESSHHPWDDFTTVNGPLESIKTFLLQSSNAVSPSSVISQLMIACDFLQIYQKHSNRTTHRITDLCPPPNPAFIDLPALISMPDPFSSQVVSRFATCHTRNMTSQHFLESDEWVGHYCYSSRRPFARFDSAMRGIRFQCSDTVDEKRMLFARGEDSCGAFEIEGWLSTHTGRLEAIKRYTGPSVVYWEWKGAIGKFGIVGSWGRIGQEGTWTQGGLFWLWLKKWCHGRRGPIDRPFDGDPSA